MFYSKEKWEGELNQLTNFLFPLLFLPVALKADVKAGAQDTNL